MRHRLNSAHLWLAMLICTSTIDSAWAGQSANMPGVENSVGYFASGTSIEPRTRSEAAPMLHGQLGNWTLMFHANGFLANVQQSGPRGGDKVFSLNWMMPMLTRQFGRQTVTFRTMLSVEPATVTKRQYPLLFQTGESAYGLSIVNGQHPHDLFMELSGRYDINLGERSQIFLYGGPVGEAALGPPGFPHRASASENPAAPLSHHQQDSTHIATNVVTLGVSKGPVQLEASTFHGREPNENRWNLDAGRPDSFATRLTVSPHKSLSAQVSTGRINNPEALDPALDTFRTTASIHHDIQSSFGHVASSFIWGRNKNLKNGQRRVFNSYALEVTSKFKRHNWIWTRIENVDRDRTLLPVQTGPPCLLCGVVGFGASVLDDSSTLGTFNHVVLGPNGRPVTVEEDPVGRVQAYTVGYEREVPLGISWLNAGLGIQVTTYGMPAKFKSTYGNLPSTAIVFMRLRPAGNMSEHMRQMHRQ